MRLMQMHARCRAHSRRHGPEGTTNTQPTQGASTRCRTHTCQLVFQMNSGFQRPPFFAGSNTSPALE
jgi:hypothetical protein